MTAITVGTGSDLPTTANTVCKALAWALEKARSIQPKQEYILDSDFPPQNVVSTAVLYIRDYGYRLSGSFILQIPEDYQVSTVKPFLTPLDLKIDANSPQNATNAFNAGTGGSIPASVNTIPKLLYWLCSLLDMTTPQMYITEDPNVGFIRVASIVQGRTVLGTPIARGRFSIPLDDNYLVASGGVVSSCREFSNVQIPQGFLS